MKQFGNWQVRGRNLALAIVLAAVTWCRTAVAQARQIAVCSHGCAYNNPPTASPPLVTATRC